MGFARFRSSCLLLVVFSLSQALSGEPPRYELLDLGTFGGERSQAYAVNSLGQVVGSARDRFGRDQPFLWERERGMQPLPTLGLGYGCAHDINDVGQVVGYVRSTFPNARVHAVLWEGGEARDLGRLGDAWQTINESEAFALNNDAWIVGASKVEFLDHAFFCQLGSQMIELSGSPWAFDINDAGTIVGGPALWENLTASTQPFLGDDSPYRYVRATAINQNGHVAGWVGDISTNDDYTHAFYWDPTDGLTDLGVLGDPDPGGLYYSYALDLNESGLVVGYSAGPVIQESYHAFLWAEEEGMVDLNDLIPFKAGWQRLEEAQGINRTGLIVGMGLRDDGERHAFLLTPGFRIHLVDARATGAADGSTWNNAFKTLQDALAVANPGDEIRVARGTYHPDKGQGMNTGDRNSTFLLQGMLAVKGGYAGVGSPDPDARDPALHETVLSGDLKSDDDPAGEQGRGDNVYHVVTLQGDVILDGFVIEGGQADGGAGEDAPQVAWKGAGLHSLDGYSRIRNCTFRRNRAESAGGSWGGGLYAAHGSLLTLEACTFEKNSARWGGGLYGGFHLLEKCSFMGNSSESHGGAVNLGDGAGSLIISACQFLENSAGGSGGALFIVDKSRGPELVNCLFSGNRASNRGGALYCNESAPLLLNCTVAGNAAPDVGGFYFTPDSALTIRNCIFHGNPGGSLVPSRAVEAEVNYSLDDGAAPWPGAGNLQEDPLFVRPPVWHGLDTLNNPSDDEFEMGDLHLQPASPCRDTGMSEGAPLVDLEGTPRPVGLRVDLGVYEFPTPVAPFFRRGDTDGDGMVDITDASRILDYLFLGKQVPACLDAADVNDDGSINISDAVSDLGFLFLGWPEPPLPGTKQCGLDPTEDAIGCESYPRCP